MTRKHFISGCGPRAVILTWLLLFSIIAAAQTTADAAQGSPYGIFVVTGSNVIMPGKASDKTSGYLVERRGSKDDHWERVALLTTPARMKDFENNLKYWCDRFPEWADYERISVDRLYPVLERTGTTDSLKFYGQLLPVRLAAGTVYLDSTVTDTLRYQYRVTRSSPTDAGKELFVTAPVHLETRTFLGRPFIVNKLVSTDEVIITCGLDPGFRPSFYRLYRKKEGEKQFSQTKPAIVRYIRNDTAFVNFRDIEVEKGKVYDYFIVPVDYFGRASDPSEIVRTGIYNFGSLREPYDILTEAVTPAGGIRITWSLDEPGLLRSMRVYRSTRYDSDYKLLKELSPYDSVFTDMTVEPMRKYFYYFVMEGFFGELSSPGVRFFGIAENTLPPLRPAISAIRGIAGGAEIEIRYFNPDIKSIRLYRRINSSAELLPVTVIPVTQEESVHYTDTSRYFTGYTLLSYAALAENTSYALSTFSDTLSVYPLADTDPIAPDDVSATLENGVISLIWNDVSNNHPEIVGYRVYRRVVEASGVRQKAFALLYDSFLQPDINYFTDTLASEGNTYNYEVRSVDIRGAESKTAAVAVISVDKAKAVAPSGMKLFLQDGGITVEWAEPYQDGIKSYRLYRYERGKRPVPIATVARGTTSYTDITAQKGRLYFYYLTTIHENGTESSAGREEGIWRE